MVAGDFPTYEEDLLGKPFVSREGRVVRKLLAEAGLGHAFLTYAIKCSPKKGGYPKKSQMASCKQNWQEEIDAVAPAVLVTMGRVSTMAALGLKSDMKLNDYVGKTFNVPRLSFPVMPWSGITNVGLGGKKLHKQTVLFFKRVKDIADGIQHPDHHQESLF